MIDLTNMKDVEKLTNEYGETWWFYYNKEQRIGILQGNDDLVDGKIFFVIDGAVPQLILNHDEKEWLRNVWNKHHLQT